MKRSLIVAMVSLSLAVCGAPAQADPITFFGEDLGPGRTASTIPNSRAAQAQFLTNISNPLVESFESFANGASLGGSGITVNFGANSATLTSNNAFVRTGTGSGIGAFATGGTRFIETGGGGDLSLIFSAPQAAFGFFATDVGDFSGSLTLRLDGSRTVTIPHTVNGSSGAGLFFGLIDVDQPFTRIDFLNSGGAGGTTDQFGFDDFTIATPQQVGGGGQVSSVPEPASLVVFGAVLAGVFGLRRRRDD